MTVTDIGRSKVLTDRLTDRLTGLLTDHLANLIHLTFLLTREFNYIDYDRLLIDQSINRSQNLESD